MNSASSSRPLMLVAIGLPGAGKSFFARQFAETFGAPLISYDEIRYELFNEIGYTAEMDEIVARIASLQLRELMKTKKTIVIDGGHNPKVNRAELAKLARTASYDIMNVWIQTDERTAYARSIKRGRGKFDIFNRSLSEDEFIALAKKFTPPSNYEKYVVISGRHTYASQARIVLKKMVPIHAPVQPQVTQTPAQTNTAEPHSRRSISIG